MKKGPLSNDEKAWVEKYYATLTVAQIASELDRSENIVTKYINRLEPIEEVAAEEVAAEEVAQEVPETTTEEVAKHSDDHVTSSKNSDFFARREGRGVTIMTKDASMAADASRANRTTQGPERYERFIHRIKE